MSATDPGAVPVPTGLRSRLAARRRGQQQLEAAARRQVQDEEDRLTGPRRQALTLWQAFAAFWRHPSPWILSAALVAAGVARVVVGGYGITDLLVPVLMVAAFPFVEWVVHVVVLHYRPVQVAGRVIDIRLARDHRAHHADPRDLPLVFIPWQTLAWLVPVDLAIGLLVIDRVGLALTAFVALAAIGLTYEWIHYLIHSDHRPVTAVYRAIWRNHRLHHYKNENYWFTVTTSGTSDRLLGTYPDPATVANSPTAKDLLGAGPAQG